MGKTKFVNAIISLVFARVLIHWCMDDVSHKKSFFTRLWSNATHLLGGKEMKDEMKDEVGWGNLPPELCGEIGKRLVSRLGILRFRSVCKQWRSSLPSPTRFPLRVPPLSSCRPDCQDLSFLISEVNVYSVGKTGYILLVFEEVDQGGKFRGRFFNPKGVEFNFTTIPFMTTSGNPNPHPLSELSWVSKAYHLRTALPRSVSQANGVKGQWEFQDKEFTRKIVIISSNPDGVNPSYARSSDLTVVAHMSSGEMKGRLALLRLGGSPENWAWETDFCSRVFEHIATYKGQLCMLDGCGRVFLMDCNSFQMTQVCESSSIAHDPGKKHFCEAFGDLYLTDISPGRKESIEAYKLSFQLKKWVKVEGLKDIADGPILALLPYFAWSSCVVRLV